MDDYPQILADIAASVAEAPAEGAVATYIPELAGVDPDKFGPE